MSTMKGCFLNPVGADTRIGASSAIRPLDDDADTDRCLRAKTESTCDPRDAFARGSLLSKGRDLVLQL